MFFCATSFKVRLHLWENKPLKSWLMFVVLWLGLGELCLYSPEGQDGAATLLLSALKTEGELKPEQELPPIFHAPD